MSNAIDTELTLRLEARDIATSLARRAGSLQRNALITGNHIHHKGTVDLVTDADLASEKLITEGIRTHFPHHRITAEEGATGSLEGEYRWLIDPLDGTTNYAHGQPHWAVSICLERDGTPLLGVVYDPPRDELFTAIAGQGAYLNGRRIHVTDQSELLQAIGATGVTTDLTNRNEGFRLWEIFNNKSQAMRRAGAAALDMAWVACGRLDFYFERPINNWDISAGALLCQEAGGSVTRYDGTMRHIDDREICASNSRLHDTVVDLVQGTLRAN